MSDESKEIRLFEDSVIKLTIKQGLETERFPVTEISESGTFVYNGETKFITNYNDINSVSGALSSGELGYTRDTNRLFVGNISEELKDSQQQTLGGVLSGNKYLGYIDSRSGAATDNSENNAAPINLGELLSSDSYRTYNFSGNPTEDKKWPRLPHYNTTYDAYDGDYMYDIYRNALVLFDHNIKPLYNSNNTINTSEPNGTDFKINGKRKTPLIPRFHEEYKSGNVLTPGQEPVYNFTKDMYGDGYVLFYNVIPDGETLTFENKGFTPTNEYYNADEESVNYSYNVIKLNKVPAKALIESLDKEYFEEIKQSQVITLSKKFRDLLETPVGWAEGIAVDTSSTCLLVNQGTNIKQSTIKLDKIEKLTNGFAANNFNEGVTDAISDTYATKEELANAINGLPSGGSSGDISFNLPNSVMDWASADNLTNYNSLTTPDPAINYSTGSLNITPGYYDFTYEENGQDITKSEQSPSSDYYLLLKVTSGNLEIDVTSGEFKENSWEPEEDDNGTEIKNSITIDAPSGYLTLSFSQTDKVTINGTNLSGYIIPMK